MGCTRISLRKWIAATHGRDKYRWTMTYLSIINRKQLGINNNKKIFIVKLDYS